MSEYKIDITGPHLEFKAEVSKWMAYHLALTIVQGDQSIQKVQRIKPATPPPAPMPAPPTLLPAPVPPPPPLRPPTSQANAQPKGPLKLRDGCSTVAALKILARRTKPVTSQRLRELLPKFSPGTLHDALSRLFQAGYVQRMKVGHYLISDLGRKALQVCHEEQENQE